MNGPDWNSLRVPNPVPTPEQIAEDRHLTPCFCGLWRTLPAGMKVGQVCQMLPCARCGAAPRLKYLGAMVELVDTDVPVTAGDQVVEVAAPPSKGPHAAS